MKLILLFLIPSLAWKRPNELLLDRNFPDLKSEPDWAISLSKKNLPLLEAYVFERQVELL
jgi:hypothetical protein